MPKPNIAALADATGICTKTLRTYLKAGVDITDADAVRAHAEAQKNRPAALETSNIREARVRKITLECERLALAIEADKGKLLPADEVRRDMIAIAHTVQTELRRFCAEIPNWAGMSAVEMDARAKKWLGEIQVTLHNPASYGLKG